ncbi:hypothetical protein GCM10009693_02970 [Leucobacter chromiireducens subsp. chromiireducens]
MVVVDGSLVPALTTAMLTVREAGTPPSRGVFMMVCSSLDLGFGGGNELAGQPRQLVHFIRGEA